MRLVKQEHAYSYPLARAVPDIGAFPIACRKAMSYNSRYKWPVSLGGVQRKEFLGKRQAGWLPCPRLFFPWLLTHSAYKWIKSLDFCQAVISGWQWSLRVKKHFPFLCIKINSSAGQTSWARVIKVSSVSALGIHAVLSWNDHGEILLALISPKALLRLW